MDQLVSPNAVIAFWREAGPEKWFAKDDAFDQACRDNFLPTYRAAARGDLNEWELTPDGALALVLLARVLAVLHGSPSVSFVLSRKQKGGGAVPQ